MLSLKCISTGSKDGNCYALRCDDHVLILDCGAPIKKIMQELNWRVNNIEGCCITHKHL